MGSRMYGSPPYEVNLLVSWCIAVLFLLNMCFSALKKLTLLSKLVNFCLSILCFLVFFGGGLGGCAGVAVILEREGGCVWAVAPPAALLRSEKGLNYDFFPLGTSLSSAPHPAGLLTPTKSCTSCGRNN